uniref:DUF7002 family protein n=1 Tax=Pseudodesulfovibrio pelocollis TaxID=3051432 RepID=UPI00255AB9AC
HSIQRHGLLSSEALLDLFEITNHQRELLLANHRPECVEIQHPVHGLATLRDQKPMRESQLARCLSDGMTPPDWYRILNRRTFFWTTEERLRGLLQARAYRGRQHCVLTIDSAQLLQEYVDAVTLSPYNSGCTLYNAPMRGRETFLPMNEFNYEAWRERGRQPRKVIVELAVDYAVQNIVRFTDSAKLMHRGEVLETFFERQHASINNCG